MTAPRLHELTARVVAWHNRHPLAQRITPAQVQAMGWVDLPFAAPRTGMADRAGSISISRWGEDAMASTNNWPERWPCIRRNSPASTTTTASRPCSVTCCGPSLCANRTNSLKRALAS